MIEKPIAKEELANIIDFLSSLPLFKKLSKSALKDLASSMTLVYLGGGETLIHQGDLESSLYILQRGRLRVFVQNNNETSTVAEISVGQIVGEIALLTNQPRTGTVRAIRDSVILKWDKEAFRKFEIYHPAEVVEIAKTAITRLVTKSRPTEAGENIITIAIAPAGDSDHHIFTQRLVQELNKIKPTLLINRDTCNKHFNQDIAQTKFSDSNNIFLNNWLSLLENQYSYIIYETDRQMTPWTERCLRQADRLFLVGEDSIHPALNSIEMSLFSMGSKFTLPYCEVVMIHPDNTVKIIGSKEWLNLRPVQGIHHVRIGVDSDFAKLIRFLTGQAIGVVLSGGGARGFVHAGVLKAMNELGIPIDFVGGTSMGSVLAAAYAKHGIENLFDWAYDEEFPTITNDYTFPMVALLRGKNLTRFFERLYENDRIEDLWTRFFSISSNVTECKIKIHDRGLLWRAVRSSISIPAIFPPMYDEKGNMLIDGGLLNNMPIDVMRKLICGGKVVAVNCTSLKNPPLKDPLDTSWLSGWKLLFKSFNPFISEDPQYDNIFNVLRAALTMSSVAQENRASNDADLLIKLDVETNSLIDFKECHKFADVGYHAALEKLPKLLE